MNRDITIHFEELEGEQVYYISTLSVVDKKIIWLSKDLALTRVEKSRGFVRDYGKACELVGLIACGQIREGVPYRYEKN